MCARIVSKEELLDHATHHPLCRKKKLPEKTTPSSFSAISEKNIHKRTSLFELIFGRNRTPPPPLRLQEKISTLNINREFSTVIRFLFGHIGGNGKGWDGVLPDSSLWSPLGGEVCRKNLRFPHIWFILFLKQRPFFNFFCQLYSMFLSRSEVFSWRISFSFRKQSKCTAKNGLRIPRLRTVRSR